MQRLSSAGPMFNKFNSPVGFVEKSSRARKCVSVWAREEAGGGSSGSYVCFACLRPGSISLNLAGFLWISPSTLLGPCSSCRQKLAPVRNKMGVSPKENLLFYSHGGVEFDASRKQFGPLFSSLGSRIFLQENFPAGSFFCCLRLDGPC